MHFEYDANLGTDLNLHPNKDAVFIPEPVPGPDGQPAQRAEPTPSKRTASAQVPLRIPDQR